MLTAEDWRRALFPPQEDRRPRYATLADAMRRTLARCEPNAALPSEDQLSSYGCVSRSTVRRALAELAAGGHIVTRRGAGSYVAGPRLEADLTRLVGFTETARAHGRTPSSVVVEARMAPADSDVAQGLGLYPGDPVYRIERVRLLDGHPAMLERAHLPARRFNGLLEADLEGSLYAAMQRLSVQALARGQERVFAVRAARRIAYLLHVEPTAPLLASIRQSWAADGAPTEVTYRYVRPDRCAYVVNLVGGSSWTVISDADTLPDLALTEPRPEKL